MTLESQRVHTGAVTIRAVSQDDARAVVMLCHKVREVLYSKIFQDAGVAYETLNSNALNEEIDNYRLRLLQKSSRLGRYVAVRDDGTLLGYLVYGVDKSNQVQLYGIYVNSEVHGQGVGSMLMNQVIALNKGRVCKLRVVDKNNRAMHFYEKFGFQSNGNKSLFRGVVHKIEMEGVLTN